MYGPHVVDPCGRCLDPFVDIALVAECTKQTTKFSEKNVHFYIKTKGKVVVGWDGPDVDDNVFLLVMQK